MYNLYNTNIYVEMVEQKGYWKLLGISPKCVIYVVNPVILGPNFLQCSAAYFSAACTHGRFCISCVRRTQEMYFSEIPPSVLCLFGRFYDWLGSTTDYRIRYKYPYNRDVFPHIMLQIHMITFFGLLCTCLYIMVGGGEGFGAS